MEAAKGAIEMKRTLALILAILVAFATPAVAASSQAKKVLSVAKKQIGAPYKLDSDSPKSFNCFSFVAYCFNEVEPGTITSSGINGPYDTITSASKLKPGDIVVFKSNRKLKGIMGYHYAIYAGKGYIIHAANKADGVTVSRLKDFKKRFVGAVRIL